MELLTAELRVQLPPLYSQENNRDPNRSHQVFQPVRTGHGSSREVVIGFEEEWGNFALSELEGARRGDLPLVERDLYFTPTTLGSSREVPLSPRRVSTRLRRRTPS